MTTSISPSERSYVITGLSHPSAPTRADGRALLDPRDIAISYNVAPAANGSARIQLGRTEVVAGIRLEVIDVPAPISSGIPQFVKGKEPWRAKVDVDITPQAYPQLTSSALTLMSQQYAGMILEHFIPSVPALTIVAPTKYFQPHLHLTLVSADGSVPTALVLAARAAFADLAVPKTKAIGWEAVDAASSRGEVDRAGIKGAVGAGRGQGRARVRGADDWDLDNEGSGVTPLPERETLPVLVTLHLVPDSDAVFLDATPMEEAACPDCIFFFFRPSGRICGMRMQGNAGIDVARIRPLLQEGKRIALELLASLNADLP